MGSTENGAIRYKVYNKFIQQLESAEVRKSLGCRMENLVEKESKFATRLERYKDSGYSRLELTFYGPELLKFKEYRSHMEDAKDLLSECTTYECALEKQWVQRAEKISSMVAVYFPKKKVFAYCHWWNSLTSKKYGYMWKNVAAKTVPLLLANYSFNDRPIHYYEMAINRKQMPSITKETTYKREPGCTAITLVPGGAKGMYPSLDAFPNGAKKFKHVGIVEVDNINIAWPKKRHNRASAPLAEILEMGDDEQDDEYIRKITISKTSSYKAAHAVLDNSTEYTVVAAGYATYRNSRYIHFITQCGLKFRAGKSLTKVWDKWRVKFQDETSYVDIPMVRKMDFLAITTIRVNGISDMKCKLA
jgi:hypothetical protein